MSSSEADLECTSSSSGTSSSGCSFLSERRLCRGFPYSLTYWSKNIASVVSWWELTPVSSLIQSKYEATLVKAAG
ncbi:hypothetical protein M5D96_006473 [Drosophila gunungcola]|uniref:Uncharacterized protein n=1 Tax=Drosophila gunungcola TaxID=103775 RepID=A0A9P9YPJ2_9MUSC|nr:hypothetical protein M5D96_006473 [Drosophila gunungcola]